MARIRSLKPEFWHDRKLARQTSRDARMLYMGLWNHADEWARANGDIAVVKGLIFPYDRVNIDALLSELVSAGVVMRYEVDGDPFLFLPNLSKHQRLEPAKVASKFPSPDEADQASDLHTQIGANSSEKTCAESSPGSAGSENSAASLCNGVRGQGGRAQKNRAMPPPDIFPITDEMREWAAQHTPNVDLGSETQKLFDWARGKGEKKADWVATWRNWMRRTQEQISERTARLPPAQDDDEAWMR
jgi:hypothetical protein